jgi:hypothetical protein
VQSKEALRMKQEVIDGLSALKLPENPLADKIGLQKRIGWHTFRHTFGFGA